MPDLFSPTTPHRNPTNAQVVPEKTPETEQMQDMQQLKPPSNENHIHALATYCINPSNLIFQGRDITNSVHLFLRRHVITNVPWILTTLALLIIPPLIQVLLTLSPTITPIPANFFQVFVLFYYLVVGMYAFLNFLNWFYNIIFITTTEIIDLDYADIVYHDVAATNVNLIEDVQYVQSGFIQGLFNYGNLFVQTAGGKENIEGLKIPKPADIARFVLTYIGKGEQGG